MYSELKKLLKIHDVRYSNLSKTTQNDLHELLEMPVVGSIIGVMDGGKMQSKIRKRLGKIYYKTYERMVGESKGGGLAIPHVNISNILCTDNIFNSESYHTTTSDAAPTISRVGLESSFVSNGGGEKKKEDNLLKKNYMSVLKKEYELKHNIKLKLSKIEKIRIYTTLDTKLKDVLFNSIIKDKQGKAKITKSSIEKSIKML